MAVIYSRSFPPDPETDLKNFQRKQAEYEAAWHATSDPLVLFEALLHATAAGQPAPDWLVTALGDTVMRGRTDQAAERFRERLRHVQRYRCVRDLRRKIIPRIAPWIWQSQRSQLQMRPPRGRRSRTATTW